MSMIAAVIGAALLGFTVYIVMQGFSRFSSGRLALSRRLKGDEFLVAAAGKIQLSEFSDIIAQCRTTGVLNIAAPRNSVCVRAGALDPALGNGGPNIRPGTLQVVRDEYGRPTPQGTQCVELLLCRHLASGRILEILLQGNWKEGKADQGLIQRRMTVRRTRW